MNSDHFIVADLKERGWTDALMRVLLGEPDATRSNPHYRSGPPMRLYLQERVIAAEQTEAWAMHIAKADARRATAQKSFDTKLAKLIAKVETEEMSVPVMPMATLIQSACDHYNNHKFEKALRRGDTDWREVTPESDSPVLQRITVNYLRHRLSPYERALRQLFGKVGKNEGYVHIFTKVSAAIAQAYPDLVEECERQAGKKGGWEAMAEVRKAVEAPLASGENDTNNTDG